MTETPFTCRKCKALSWLLFILDMANRPVLARCRACGYDELL